jgi:uncharacterized repeat protein (TIGR03803 family)
MSANLATFEKVIEIPANGSPFSGRRSCLTPVRQLLLAAGLLLSVLKAPAGVVFTNLYSFTGTRDGGHPLTALVQGSDGCLYGTNDRGTGGRYGDGAVFKISTSGALTLLHVFTETNDVSGVGLVLGNDGYFYGTTVGGGSNGFGSVFQIRPDGHFVSLYSFAGGTNGASPWGSLVQGRDGCFYGTTDSGGTNGLGTVFRISTNGVLASLYSFTGGTNGADPNGGLVPGSDGLFYGTTYGGDANDDGTVFKIDTNGVLTTLYSFPGGAHGANPIAGLVQGGDGELYGTCYNGGSIGGGGWALGNGTVFKIHTNGVLAGVYLFAGTNGANPLAGLVQGSDGYFYGTTTSGGAANGGTVFRMSPGGVLTLLHSFTGSNDGLHPDAGLMQGSDGNFYGTTYQGGTNNYGTIFRLTIVPELQSLTLTNGTLALTWRTEAGGIYQLQASASLTTPNWTNLGSPVTATNGTTSFTDSATNAPQRFYRVSLAP